MHFVNTPCYLDSGTKKQVYFVSGMVVGPSVGFLISNPLSKNLCEVKS